MVIRLPRYVVFSLLTAAIVLIARINLDGQTYTHGQNVQPVFEGWEKNPDGTFSMYFGYLNRNHQEELIIPVGPNNVFEPADADRGQPTYFYPRRQRYVFKVTVPADWGEKDLVWTLTAYGKTDKAIGYLNPYMLIDEQVISMNRSGGGSPDEPNQAPSLRVNEVDLKRTVSLNDSLTLNAVIGDDAIPKPRPAPPSRPPGRRNALGLRLNWILYRGPAPVAIHPFIRPFVTETLTMEDHTPGWKPPEIPPDGKMVTTIKFKQPGTYVLRAIADDGYLYSTQDVTVTVEGSSSATAER